MEENKLNKSSIIGFGLIFLILIWMLYNQKPTEEEIAAEKAKQELLQSQNKKKTVAEENIPENKPVEKLNLKDSLQLHQFKNQIGVFQYGIEEGLEEKKITLENDLVHFKISNKGGQIVTAKMKKFVTYDSLPLYLIKDHNASFNLLFKTKDNREIQTKEVFFEPSLTETANASVLSMKLKASENAFLEYRYELKKGSYMMDFTIRSQGLAEIFHPNHSAVITWDLKGRRNSKSIQYENRYTELVYQYEENKIDELSASGTDEETETGVTWLSYKQHFFSSILVSKTPLNSVQLTSTNLAQEESKTALFTKQFNTKIPLENTAGEWHYNWKWYHGPTDIEELSKYKDIGLDESIPFGWGIFGAINRYVFTPTYTFLSSIFPYGIAIVLMTILVRLLMSPVTYKSYLSQAKMKVLKPEITEIHEKYKNNPMKKQQETMKLYGKTGVNPMSGCLPALLQLPVFYALFMFFPSAFALRQKSFLWAEDLSAYDSVLQLPFSIPFYGDHVSLFPILASIAIFIYMQMTTGQNTQMQQPGMPNMKFIMYLSPLMMLFFFNSYASGLSLYYFVSNLITIFIMLAIKNWIINEDKILVKIEENKQKPKKQNKFQRKMAQIMEQAEAHKKAQQKGRK